jgi:hypothetical protein
MDVPPLKIPAQAFLAISDLLSDNNLCQELAYIISILKAEIILFSGMVLRRKLLNDFM